MIYEYIILILAFILLGPFAVAYLVIMARLILKMYEDYKATGYMFQHKPEVVLKELVNYDDHEIILCDHVRCIDSKGVEHYLDQGRVYVVTYIKKFKNYTVIKVGNCVAEFSISRFELVK